MHRICTSPRKRKAEEENEAPIVGSKRLKSPYYEEYRKSFNEILSEVVHDKHRSGKALMNPSTIGGTSWSSEEKLAFFHVLARKGKNDSRGLAAALRTKSEPEVRVCLQFLLSAATTQDLYSSKRKGLFDLSTIGAALEVDESCETALEDAADALSSRQYREEEDVEKKRCPHHWLVTRHTMKWIDECFNTSREGDSVLSHEVPFALLFKPSSFLKLSKHFFMNSYDRECNWRTHGAVIKHRSRFPSVMFSAFSDLHVLTVRLTRRLVQSSLFLAGSRIEAEKDHMTPNKQIRQTDVLAAIQLAGLHLNADKTWIGLARKCNLRVFENVQNKRAWGKEYSFDEVEEYLSNHDNRRGRYRSRTRSPSSQSRQSSETEETPGSDVLSEGETFNEGPPHTVSSNSFDSTVTEIGTSEDSSMSVTDDFERKQQRQESLQDAYMEACDMQASHEEGRRLWEVLGESNTGITSADEGGLPKRTLPSQKSRQDFIDWVNLVDYAAEWETCATIPTEEDFEANHKARLSRWRPRDRKIEAKGVAQCEPDTLPQLSEDEEGETPDEFMYSASSGDGSGNER